MKSAKWIGRGYLVSGIANILGILICSKSFSNRDLSDQFPEVFSPFGMVIIILWGLAYISVASNWEKQKALAGVFALEKLVYVLSWFYWLFHKRGNLPDLFERSPLTGTFYMVYGLNDLLFMLLFAVAFCLAGRRKSG